MSAFINNVFWPWLNLGTVIRPSRLTPKNKKDQNYDSTCARYYLGNVWEPYRSFYLNNYASNLRYATGGAGAWGETQDIRMFLGDQTNATGRLALQSYVVQPMLTRLVGAADNISVAAEAHPATQFAYTRKEADLAKQLIYAQAAQAGPAMQQAYGAIGVPADEDQAQDMHELNYQDEFAEAENSLLAMMGLHQGLDRKKRQLAQNLALSGVAMVHFFANGGHIECEVIKPEEGGWDTSAVRPDLSDGEYCWTARLMGVSAIAEQYPASREKIAALDRWANMTGSNIIQPYGWPQRRPRVFTVYYKDMEYVERGYVLKDGEPHYCTINRPDPDTGVASYTDADLIPPPTNRFTLTWTDKEMREMKQTKAIQVVRYCAMVPWEYLPGPFTEGKPYSEYQQVLTKQGKGDIVSPTGDLILDSGEYPLQETDPDQVFEVEFPIKFATWSYMAGNVIAPLSAARDPQRVKNMVLSDLMWRMEKAPLPSMIVDSDALSGSGMREADFWRAIKNADPAKLKGSLTNGLQQAVQTTGTTLNQNFFAQWGVLDQLDTMAQNSTGIYAQNFGSPADPRQLVGNKQLQLQQAGVMMQPFYAALSDCYRQMHQFNAQAGKLFYSARPWALSQMVGDEGMQALLLSKDMTAEQFRVEITLSIDSTERKKEADALALTYLQMGLLDQPAVAQLLGRSYPEDVAEATRQYTTRMQQQAQMQAQAQAQQAQQAAFAVQQQNIDAQQAELQKQQVDASLKVAQIEQKRDQPIQAARASWMEAPEQVQETVTG